ncbi:MAG: YraN family protein [Oscillospiraceae bacterium]|nr:YraN family protein [Oscillospiraceae bacterium]
MKQKLIGAWGEATAAEYLQNRRYTVISMGYRCRFGEIDIIATNKKYIAFVEVKTRKDSGFAEAREFVNHHKMGRLRQTAEMWLSEHETTLQPRFDVIEIYAPQGADTNSPEIRHLEDAFQ